MPNEPETLDMWADEQSLKLGDTVVLTAPDDTTCEAKILDYKIYSYDGKNTTRYGFLYSYPALGHFVHTINHAIKKKWDRLILVSGPERTGKSALAIQLAMQLNPGFSLDNVCFEMADFNAKLEKAKPGEVVILDEGGASLFNQEWFQEVQKNLIKKLMVVGKRQVIVIICIPHKDNLNAKLVNNRFDYWCSVYAEGKDMERGFCEIREAKKNRWALETYWAPFLSLKYPPVDKEFWEAYEEKKDAFIQKVMADSYHPDGENDGESMREGKTKRSRDVLIKFILDKEYLNQTQMSKMIGLSQNQISGIYKKMNQPEDDTEDSDAD